MTEQEFRESASKKGLRDENIASAIQIYHTVKATMPNLELDENMIKWMLEAQESNDSRTKEFVTVEMEKTV